MLGNGGVGKTKLIGRLQGQSFESTPEGSTHGVRLIDLPFEDCEISHPVRLNIWDFGGQDIYHGTHALFLQSLAIYILLYSKSSENECEFEDGGVRMRNRPLKFWFDYLLQAVGEDGEVKCPVLFAQSKCDTPADEDREPPYTPEEGFSQLSTLLHVSAKGRGRGLANFREKLREDLVTHLKEHPQPPLPKSWSNVREELRRLQRNRSPRAMSRDEFTTLCEMHGCGSDVVVLRDALHHMGVVFYREGIFANQIILDQSWVLEAVYTIFNRNEQFQRLVRTTGRFTRYDLERFFWHKYSTPDQLLFLSFMIQCKICFRASRTHNDDSPEFIAPDLLEPWGTKEDADFAWHQHLYPKASVTVEYGLLHDGILRTFLSQIGTIAGDQARYWKFGCYLHDRTSDSQACISVDGNKIVMRAWFGDAHMLLQKLLDLLKQTPFGQLPVISWEGKKLPESDQEILLVPYTPVQDRNLARLEERVFTRITELVTFYLIGCAFRDGKNSLNKVAEELDARQQKGKIPEEVNGKRIGVSTVHLSKIIKELEAEVFFYHFDRETKLIKVKAKSWVLSDDGMRAWKDTGEFFLHRKERLVWEPNSDSDAPKKA